MPRYRSMRRLKPRLLLAQRLLASGGLLLNPAEAALEGKDGGNERLPIMTLSYAEQVLSQLRLELGMPDLQLLTEVLAQGLWVDRRHLGDPLFGNGPAGHHLDDAPVLVSGFVRRAGRGRSCCGILWFDWDASLLGYLCEGATTLP